MIARPPGLPRPGGHRVTADSPPSAADARSGRGPHGRLRRDRHRRWDRHMASRRSTAPTVARIAVGMCVSERAVPVHGQRTMCRPTVQLGSQRVSIRTRVIRQQAACPADQRGRGTSLHNLDAFRSGHGDSRHRRTGKAAQDPDHPQPPAHRPDSSRVRRDRIHHGFPCLASASHGAARASAGAPLPPGCRRLSRTYATAAAAANRPAPAQIFQDIDWKE